jgi:hypothetical protein
MCVYNWLRVISAWSGTASPPQGSGFENARGAAGAMEGSVISLRRAASLQEVKTCDGRRIERNPAEHEIGCRDGDGCKLILRPPTH